jgi:hypothetical protein
MIDAHQTSAYRRTNSYNQNEHNNKGLTSFSKHLLLKHEEHQENYSLNQILHYTKEFLWTKKTLLPDDNVMKNPTKIAKQK